MQHEEQVWNFIVLQRSFLSNLVFSSHVFIETPALDTCIRTNKTTDNLVQSSRRSGNQK
jgi:hypothetical protein